jgi:hypothetical protein
MDEPGCVVPPSELVEGEAEVLDGLEGLDPQELLLEGPDESLGDAVARGFGERVAYSVSGSTGRCLWCRTGST